LHALQADPQAGRRGGLPQPYQQLSSLGRGQCTLRAVRATSATGLSRSWQHGGGGWPVAERSVAGCEFAAGRSSGRNRRPPAATRRRSSSTHAACLWAMQSLAVTFHVSVSGRRAR
jgi:hypothetical protein